MFWDFSESTRDKTKGLHFFDFKSIKNNTKAFLEITLGAYLTKASAKTQFNSHANTDTPTHPTVQTLFPQNKHVT